MWGVRTAARSVKIKSARRPLSAADSEPTQSYGRVLFVLRIRELDGLGKYVSNLSGHIHLLN